MIPRPSGAVRSRSAISSCGSPKNSVPPPSSSWTSWRSSTPIVGEATPPIPVSSALPSLGGEEGEQRAQVGEVEQRQPLLVGVAEDEREALLLRLVRLQHLAEQQRPEVGHGRAHRHAGADAAEREVLDREAGRLEGLAELLPPLGGDAVRVARRGEAGEVALHVGGEDRTRPPPRAARRSPAGPSSCRCRSRRRSGRGGSSSAAGSGRPPSARPCPSWTPWPSSSAAPSPRRRRRSSSRSPASAPASSASRRSMRALRTLRRMRAMCPSTSRPPRIVATREVRRAELRATPPPRAASRPACPRRR